MRQSIYALTLVLLLTAAAGTRAQQFYNFAISSSTYTELTNDTPISTVPTTVGYYLRVPFKMEAFGVPFDFGESDTSVVVFVGAYVAPRNFGLGRIGVFDAFTSDLRNRDSGSAISYVLEGSGEDKVLKFQWKNMALNGHPASDYVNVQLWLYQKDNSFEVHVGPNRVTSRTAYFGYTGPSVGTFLSNADLTAYLGMYHLFGSPASPAPDRFNPYVPMSATPPDGIVYRFTYTKGASVAVSEKETSGASFHPNPTTGATYITLPESLRAARPTMILHDMMGREALRLDEVNDGDRIETDMLGAGVYYVTLRKGEKVYAGERIVVRR